MAQNRLIGITERRGRDRVTRRALVMPTGNSVGVDIINEQGDLVCQLVLSDTNGDGYFIALGPREEDLDPDVEFQLYESKEQQVPLIVPYHFWRAVLRIR